MERKLTDICKIQYGYAFDSAKFSNSEGVPLIRIRDVVRGYSETYTTEDCSAEYVVNDGDMLIGMDGEFNISRWKGGKAYLNQRVCRLIPTNEVDALYLFYFMPKALKAIEEKTPFVTVKHLSAKELNKVVVPVPTMDEQKRIAGGLQKVDELIILRKEQLVKLDQLVKSRFIELFGDPKLNDKGWKSGIVSDYFEVKGGKRIPKGMGYSDKKTDHPYLRATDMKNETILEDDIHYIDEDVFQHIKRYTVKGGDIYLTNVGVNLGMAGVIPQKFDGASLTENAVKLVPKTEKVIDGLFLAHYINSSGIQEYINERKMSVGVPKLAIFRIETMPLLIPPMDIQQDFNTFVEQTDKSKLAIQQSLDKLELLKKSLMQQYFG